MTENRIRLRKYTTGKGLNIISVGTDKFKTNSINLFIHNQLDRSTVTQNALLPMVLRRGSKDYPTMQEISRKLESLYGSTFDCGVVKKGERQILHFYIDGVNDKFLESRDSVFDSCAFMLNSIVSNPLINDGRFREEYVEQEKQNLSKMIRSRINDKTRYAVERCYELMCSNERYGLHEWGSINDLDGISPAALADRYSDAVSNSRIDVVIVGNINDDWISRLEAIINIKTSNDNSIAPEDTENNVKEVNTFIEEMEVNQGKLSMGFRTNVDAYDPDYYALLVYSSILGGGAHSKLHQNVREKASLAYYAFARLEKIKGLMMVGSGIEAVNYEETREIILRQINEMKEGNISDFEFDSSKKVLENGIRAMTDEPLQMVDFFLTQSILDKNYDFETVTNKIRDVKREDVARVAHKVKLDTVYFLKPRSDA